MPKIIRKSDWKPHKVVDLQSVGDDRGTCSRCGKRGLRFVHTLKNLAGDRLEVGSECATRLCSDYLLAS
jgi:hypothetical protein